MIALSVSAAAEPGERVDTVSATAGATGESERAASGHASVDALLVGSTAEGSGFLAGRLSGFVDRLPWLGARRELALARYSALDADLVIDAAREVSGAIDTLGFPVEMGAGLIAQHELKVRLHIGVTMAEMCWKRDDEPMCVSPIAMRATGILDDVRSSNAVMGYVGALRGIHVGPLRVDARLGGAWIERLRKNWPESSQPEFESMMLAWDLAVRSRIGDLALALATRRESFVAVDSALAFEDRAELVAAFGERFIATAFATRTRLWRGLELTVADSYGGEVALAARLAGFDIVTRVAAGRSFYSSLDAAEDQPAFGVRATLDISRTFELYRGVAKTASKAP